MVLDNLQKSFILFHFLHVFSILAYKQMYLGNYTKIKRMCMFFKARDFLKFLPVESDGYVHFTSQKLHDPVVYTKITSSVRPWSISENVHNS